MTPQRPSVQNLPGLDVDGAALEKARRAVYHQNSLRAVTPPLLDRHFVKDGGGGRVREASRKVVSFRAGNLLDPASYASLAPLDVGSAATCSSISRTPRCSGQ